MKTYGVPVYTTTTQDPVTIHVPGKQLARSEVNGALFATSLKYKDSAQAGLEPREFLMTPDLYLRFRDRSRDALSLTPDRHDMRDSFWRMHLSKWIPENGAAPGWYVPPILDFSKRVEPPFSGEIFEWLRSRAYRNWPTLSDFKATARLRVPTDSSHGAPTFGSGLDDLFAHLALAAEMQELSSPRDLRALIGEANALTGLQVLGSRPAIITHSRTGPMKKPTPTREFIGDALTETGSSVGVYCRSRHVRGMPTWLNEVLRPVVMWSQMGLKRWYGFGHGADDMMEEKFRATYRRAEAFGAVHIISDDASNFDDTVSLKHLEQLRDQFYLWGSEVESWLYSEVFVTPVLSGPLKRDAPCGLYERAGGIPSGLISTTLDDTLINMAIVVQAMAPAAKKTVAEVLKALDTGELGLWVQGDDTLIFTSWEVDREVYVATAAHYGYVRKVEDYPVFLMRWYGKNGSHNSAVRAAMRTASRESRTLGPAFERFATYNRWLPTRLDPKLDLAIWLMTGQAYTADELSNPGAHIEAPELVAAMKAEMGGPQGLQRSIRFVRDLLARGVNAQQLAVLRRVGLLDIYAEEAIYAESGSGYEWRTHFRKFARDNDSTPAGRWE